MKVNIYSTTKTISDDFIEFVADINQFDYQWKPINKITKMEAKPHFSIFLLNLQSAASSWMIERINELIQLGAHHQSLYFVLIDKEVVSKSSDIELVVLDLQAQLSKYIENPQIDVISLKAFKAFKENNEKFLYYDTSVDQHRTIKQLAKGDTEDFQTFIQYHGQLNVINKLQLWAECRYLLFWKNITRQALLTYNVPQVIIQRVQQLGDIHHIKAETLQEFTLLKQDHQFISLHYISNHENFEESSGTNFLIGKNLNNDKVHYFNKDIYELKKLPIENILRIESLVFLDEKGYPKPKTKIQDWSLEIENISGFTQLIKEIGVKLL